MIAPDDKPDPAIEPTVDDVMGMLEATLEPGQNFEIRAVGVDGAKGARCRQFNYEARRQAAELAIELGPRSKGVYCTLNPVRDGMNPTDGTGHADVLRYATLLIDVDPVRESGTSATDAEKNAAIQVMAGIRGELTGRGWPAPMVCDSGNGEHNRYRIDLPNDDLSQAIIKRCLLSLAARHNTAEATVDTGVHDAPRVARLYGTPARKGEPTPDRPHRHSRIIAAPARPDLVGLELLEALAKDAPAEEPARPRPPRSSKPPGPVSPGTGKPGDDFNARTTWRELMEGWGWTVFQEHTDKTDWTRPGKDASEGLSATTNYLGSDVLWVFSDNTPFEVGRSYDRFGAWCLMNFGGTAEEHFAAATKALGAAGYGDQRRTRARAKAARPEPTSENVADLHQRAVAAATIDLGAFYKDRGLMVELAALQATDAGAFAALKAALRKVDGFRAADFNRIIKEVDERAEPEAPEAAESRYFDEGTGFATVIEGNTIPLTDFRARIVEELTRDDGSGETRRRYKIECALRDGEVVEAEVPADRFGSMGWVAEHLGSRAVIHAGRSVQDHARTAIQLASDAIGRTVFVHTGWRQVGGTWHYLSAGGAIGPDGINPDILVDLSDQLADYRLPEPPEGIKLVGAVRACLGILDLGQAGRKGSKALAAILAAAPWRAALGASTCAIQFKGMTGCQKSSAAALAQQHFGREMNKDKLPGSWDSTVNALGELQFLAKDAILVVDDFVPGGTPINAAQQHSKVEQIFRAAGNLQGRKRMNADMSLRAAKPPRGTLFSTGEDRVNRTSANARSLPASFVKPAPERGIEGTIDKVTLTLCQKDANAGVYASAMAGFVRYVAPRYEQVVAKLRECAEANRPRAVLAGQHDRTPENVAELAAGFDAFLDFAVAIQAIDQPKADDCRERVWVGLMESAEDARADMASQGTPVDRFFQLLASALSSTKAYLGDVIDNRAPIGMETPCGWKATDRLRGGVSGYPDEAKGDYQAGAGAPLIGWYDAKTKLIYLDPEEAHRVIAAMAQAQGESIPSPVTMRRNLADAGKLAERDSRNAEEGKGRLTARKSIQKVRREVLVIRADDLWPGEAEAIDHDADEMTIAFGEDAA